MIIGIDGNEANAKKRVGVGRYAFELLKQFWKIRNSKFEILKKSQIPNFKFQIYLKEKPLPDLPPDNGFWRYKVVGPKRFWTQIGLPLNLYFQKPRPDVFFTPTHYAPRFCPCPSVISVMDLSYLHFPEMFKKNDLWQLRNWTAYSVKKATKILTISKASKDDIIRYYRVPVHKVIVTYPGVASSIKNKVLSMKDIRKKYGIVGNYILSVGTIQPRKNYERLIKAFSQIVSSIKYRTLSLMIVGKKGWLWENILSAPQKYGVEKKVKFLDFVPDEDLPALYKRAKCFVLVSLCEGFVIPVLEAMNFGCPVVVSNVSSLPEVVGEGGVLVDPKDVEEIAEGIKKAIAQREQLIKKGYQQARKFSWEKCAKETLKVLEEVGRKNY